MRSDITIDQFLKHIKTIEEMFEKKFSENKKEYIFTIVKNITDVEMSAITTYFIDYKRTLPLPLDFREAIRGMKRHRPETNVKEVKRVKCEHCFHTGLRYAKDIQIDFDVLFICGCHENNKRHGYKLWDEKYKPRYLTVTFPLNKFKPTDKKVGGQKMNSIVKWWRKELENSKLYWEANP